MYSLLDIIILKGDDKMNIITTHIYADLDALSSMIIAKRLYPDATLVFPGNVSDSVKKYITLYQDYLQIVRVRDIDFDNIDKLIVVDTSKTTRIGRFAEHLESIEDIIIYDHHPSSSHDIDAPTIRREYGSNTTHLLEHLFEIYGRDLHLEPYEINAALMGIYEDTGNFTYSNTKPIDLEIGGFLLSKGGDLKTVHEYTTKTMNEEQKNLLIKFIEAGEVIKISEERIFISRYQTNSYQGGVDEIINKIKELEECSACFIICGDDTRSNIIARSSSIGIRLNEILSNYKGGGHWSAMSLVARDTPLEEIYKDIKIAILENVQKGKLARDIMTSPVKTIEESTRVRDAYKLMKQFGYMGLPVVEEGRLVGIISRRDVDKTILHGFSNAPVRVYMNTNIISASMDTSLEELKRKLVENEIGRIPILKGENLMGIVTRADILRGLVMQRNKINKGNLIDREIKKEDILSNINNDLRLILDSIRLVSRSRNERAFLVGGIVRDIVLKIKNEDIDIVVEGSGIDFALDLGKLLNAQKVITHDKFKTAVVIVNNNLKIDVATSRVEYYEYPTSLPIVDYGSIREDMYRRDFTINAIALEVDEASFGTLVDYYNGYKDILSKKIRILHNMSFIEDPTRIIRAFRFASRYNFILEEETKRLLEDSIENGFLRKVSWPRVKNELKIILGDRNPLLALEYLEKYSILETVHPKIILTKKMKEQMERIPSIENLIIDLEVDRWLIYFLLMLEDLTSKDLSLVFLKFGFSQGFKKKYKFGIGKRSEIIKNIKKCDKNSHLYDILKGISNEVILLLFLEVDESTGSYIKNYIYNLRNSKRLIGGNDLLELTDIKGRELGAVLDYAFMLQLDNPDMTRNDIINRLREEKKIGI